MGERCNHVHLRATCDGCAWWLTVAITYRRVQR